jgi:hypothetical protein
MKEGILEFILHNQREKFMIFVLSPQAPLHEDINIKGKTHEIHKFV